jgi:hypothetical protein
VKTNATFVNQSTISPGQSAGTLEFQDVVLSMQTGSTYRYEFDSLGSDLIRGVGTNDTLTLGTGGIIDLVSLDGTSPLGTWWTLFDGFETINGSMNDWTVHYAGHDWNAQFSIQAGGLSLMIPVPEPSTVTLLLSAVAVIAGIAWRRRHRQSIVA